MDIITELVEDADARIERNYCRSGRAVASAVTGRRANVALERMATFIPVRTDVVSLAVALPLRTLTIPIDTIFAVADDAAKMVMRFADEVVAGHCEMMPSFKDTYPAWRWSDELAGELELLNVLALWRLPTIPETWR